MYAKHATTIDFEQDAMALQDFFQNSLHVQGEGVEGLTP
jgi:hypothetical protein